MKPKLWTVRIAALAVMLVTLLLPVVGVAAQGGIVPDSVNAEPFGTYDGVDYTRYTGQFAGATGYDVPFEIVAPDDPTAGNGILVLEPYHLMGNSACRDGYITNDLLFGEGFSYAGLRWHPEDVNPLESYDADEAVKILSSFVLMLQESLEARDMVGTLKGIYGLGVSNTTGPLLAFLASPSRTLLDFTYLVVPAWPHETFEAPADANPIMVLLTESDIVRSAILGLHTDALRGSAPNYRSYEIAGAPHMPDCPWVREVGPLYGLTAEGTTPLDTTPIIRSLFLAGHRWAAESSEPPPSTHLAKAPAGQIDPVYKERFGLELETGIRRDADGNAVGGIRLPELDLGRGTYVAVDPESPYMLFGTWTDLMHAPRPDHSARFDDQETYLAAYTAQTDALVNQSLVMTSDADAMVVAAAGSPGATPVVATEPTVDILPETGHVIPILWLTVAGILTLGLLTATIGRERRQ